MEINYAYYQSSKSERTRCRAIKELVSDASVPDIDTATFMTTNGYKRRYFATTTSS